MLNINLTTLSGRYWFHTSQKIRAHQHFLTKH